MPKDKKPKSSIGETKAAYGARRRSPDWKKQHPKGSFWNPYTLEELVAQQGTKPLTDKDFERPDFWPEGEDVDAFIQAAKGGRYRPRK
jgi:hypothetical protein